MTFLWMLEGIRTPFLDWLMQLVTYAGQEVILLVVICAFYWCIDKRFAYILGLTYFTAGLFIQTLKITFRIPRPWVLDPDFKAVESAIPGATGYSFPSGHTQGATSLFFPLALKTRKLWLRILFVLAFVLIGFSRMYLGCHTPKDVLVSMALSILISSLIWHFREALFDTPNLIRPTAIILAAIALAVMAFSLILSGNGVVQAKYAADSCKAAGAGLGFALGYYVERTRLKFDTHTEHIWGQVLKLVIGLLVALLLKEGLSVILGESIPADIFRYFILVLWMLVLYPCIFSRFVHKSR